jgi:hypothetical protein
MSKASRLKGHCNRLCTISELPAHQVQTWWRFILVFGKGGSLVPMRGSFLLAVPLLVILRMSAAFGAVSSPAKAVLNPASPAPY